MEQYYSYFKLDEPIDFSEIETIFDMYNIQNTDQKHHEIQKIIYECYQRYLFSHYTKETRGSIKNYLEDYFRYLLSMDEITYYDIKLTDDIINFYVRVSPTKFKTILNDIN